MDPGRADRPVDERVVRVAQGVVAVVLLAAFVFALAWVVPLVAAVTAVGAVRGPDANVVHLLAGRIARRRAAPAGALVPAEGSHALDLVAAAALGVASVFLVVGLEPLAWVCTLAEAAVAAVAASTGYNAAATLLDRLQRRG